MNQFDLEQFRPHALAVAVSAALVSVTACAELPMNDANAEAKAKSAVVAAACNPCNPCAAKKPLCGQSLQPV